MNSALYGVERFFDVLVETMKEFKVAPMNVLGVWDGLGAKQFRQSRLPGYKVGREKNPAVHAQLSLAREHINEALRHVGITCVHVDGREADDVIAYLTKHLRDRHNIVDSVDGDLAVLVDDNTSVWTGTAMNVNPFGPFPHKYITLYKALVGDTGDKIPGAKGFGDVAWCDLVRVFGFDGLDALIDLILTGKLNKLQEDVAEFPKLSTIINNAAMVYTSWWAAELHPEEVNTLRKPLVWAPAMAREWNEVPETVRVPSMREWYGTKLLVTSLNYARVKEQVLSKWVRATPFVALDIETSSSPESDEWLQASKSKSAKGKIDALGHNLTGMSLTFGDNAQHTIYMSVDHADTPNISVDQCREMVEVFDGVPLVAHNRAFEFQVLYRTWGAEWKDNGWHGFLPNCMDTLIESSYVDENISKGLKLRSKTHLGYEQQTYEDVTTMEGPLDVIPKGGEVLEGPFTKVITEAVIEDFDVEQVDQETCEVTVHTMQREIEPAVIEDGWYRKQYRMNELTGQRVLNYGCDDTICTAWLHNWYYLVMQIEGTWSVYQEVEILPQYLTSLAFVQGCRIDSQRLRDLEKEDRAAYEVHWAVLRDYLFTKGWAGTTKPVYEDITPAIVKEVVEMVTGEEFATRNRKAVKVAADLREAFPDNEEIAVLAAIVEGGDVASLNKLVDRHFDGEPKINFDSPRQMQKLLYGVIGITPRLYNKLTVKEKQDDAKVEAFSALRRINKGSKIEVKPEWRAIWMSKGSTDDDAVALALAKDDLAEVDRAALQAFVKIKEITTRLKMFYGAYKAAIHWTDKRMHPELNQCGTVTRRHSSSNPNIQQVPGKGEGAKMREVFLPHKRGAIFVSVDLSGQELRGIAHASGDAGMRSCYVGEKLRDIHSLVAVQAAPLIWGEKVTYEEFMAMRKSEDPAVAAKAKELRDKAKTVVFGSNYGAQALNLSIQLKTDEDTAQKFLDALDAAFPRVNQWKEECIAQGLELGYSKTFMGARRHLQSALRATDRGDASRAERQLSNAVIQSSGAEQIKQALSNLWRDSVFFRYDAAFFAPIHDEVCASVFVGDNIEAAIDFILELHGTMIKPFGGMSIPASSSLALGLDFSCPLEVGENPTRDTVKAAILSLLEGAE